LEGGVVSKYAYYIVDTMNGNVVGTDDASKARNLATSDDYFVIESETGRWLCEDGTPRNIKEIP
jgi:hypothetical protein